jgi:hypothetical protein
VVSSMAVTSLSGKSMCVIRAVLNKLLLMYIDDLGCSLFRFVGSYNVHEGCLADHFVYDDQYCSLSSKIAYCFVSGSLRMLCVRDWLLWRLFCSIRSSLFISMEMTEGFRLCASPCFEMFPYALGIHET